MNLTEALARTETMWDQGHLLSAKAQYEDLLSQYSDPTARAKISYEYAVLHYRHTGDGEEARRLFQVVMEQYAKVETKMDSRDREIEVNACENLMLLSLSYEDYEKWAEHLAKIAPDSKMLSQYRESVHDMRDRGIAWFEVMHLRASAYYDPDPSKNQGLYASAAATLQLMLKNRETLRFSRSDWGFATSAYAEIVWLITGECYQKQKRAGVDVNTQEFLFVVQDAIPLIEHYVNANPSDAEAQDQLRELNDLLKFPSNAEISALSGVSKTTQVANPIQPVTGVWISYAVGGTAAALFSFLIFRDIRFPWNVAAGVFCGFVIGLILQLVVRAVQKGSSDAAAPATNLRRESQELAPRWQTSKDLERAIANSGVNGLRFTLSSINIEEDFIASDILVLTFRPMDSIPSGKEHAAGLALRCIVGLTLPSLDARTSGLRLQSLPTPYTVALGKGVRISPTLIVRGEDLKIPVKTSSRESEDNWYVEIKPVIIPMGGSPKQFAIPRQLLEGLIPAFESLNLQPVVLSGQL